MTSTCLWSCRWKGRNGPDSHVRSPYTRPRRQRSAPVDAGDERVGERANLRLGRIGPDRVGEGAEPIENGSGGQLFNPFIRI